MKYFQPLRNLLPKFFYFAVSDEDNTCLDGFNHKQQGLGRISVDGTDMHNEVEKHRGQVMENGYILLSGYQNKEAKTAPVPVNIIWNQLYSDTEICRGLNGLDITQIYWKFV